MNLALEFVSFDFSIPTRGSQKPDCVLDESIDG